MKSFLASFFFAAILITLCSPSLNAQYNWVKDPPDPIFSGSGNGTWDKHVFNPNVLFNADSNRYEMWYTGSYGPPAWRPYRIGFAVSEDGINWTKYNGNPVLAPDAGTWDEGSTEGQFVLRENGEYKMWYTGYSNLAGDTVRIGYATSSDGINWNKHPDPVLTADNTTWESNFVGYNSVISNAGIFTMYYSGYYAVGRASSIDGINWEKDTLNNPVLNRGAAGEWDDFLVGLPQIILKDNTLYMYYTAFKGSISGIRQIGAATSTNNGASWEKYQNNPILTPGPAGSWDASYVEGGTVMLIEDTVHMWYDGAREPTGTYLWNIGHATALFTVPVELISFTSSSDGKEATLNWATSTEINNLGFEVQRGTERTEFLTIGFVKGHGTTTEQQNYSFSDKNLNNGKNFYRLKQIDFNGSFEYSDVIEVEWKAFNSYMLEQNYPNPFNPATTIGFGIQEKTSVRIIVLNAIGEQVAVVLNEDKEPGYHQVKFNAANLPSGVYLYQIKAGNFVETKKMILLK